MHHESFLDRCRDHRSDGVVNTGDGQSTSSFGARTLGFEMHPAIGREGVVKPDAVIDT
jgi:hypothetical protein